MDGHATFPLELEEFFLSCKNKLKKPFDDSPKCRKEWQELVDTYERNWSSSGGVVFHIVSISFDNTSSTLKCVRYQIGDCNSIFISNGVKMPLMYRHNIFQMEELQRVMPYIENGRVGNVLSCTRVLGNKDLKEKLPDSLLTPRFLVETSTFSLNKDDSKGMFICGTDGIMSSTKCLQWLQKVKCKNMNCIQLADECMNRTGKEDNVSFIIIEFLYLSISV